MFRCIGFMLKYTYPIQGELYVSYQQMSNQFLIPFLLLNGISLNQFLYIQFLYPFPYLKFSQSISTFCLSLAIIEGICFSTKTTKLLHLLTSQFILHLSGNHFINASRNSGQMIFRIITCVKPLVNIVRYILINIFGFNF